MVETSAPARPLASFLLLTYNQRAYVDDALAGALGQDFSPLEVVISDDGSTDGTYERLKQAVAAYRGPHHVRLLPRSRNAGWTANVNRTFALAAGRFLVIAAGDDVSLPGRTRHMLEHWRAVHEGAVAIFSGYHVTDAAGSVVGCREYPDGRHDASLARRIQGGVPVEGATAAYDRDVFDRFGPLRYRAVNEDVILQFRAALLDGVFTVSEPLVHYRKWHGGLSSIEAAAASAEQESLNERLRLLRVLRCLFNFRRDTRKLARHVAARAAELDVVRTLIDKRIRAVILRRSMLSASLLQRISHFASLTRIDSPLGLRVRDLLYMLHPGTAFHARLLYRRLRRPRQVGAQK